jgi:hypothetical protein
VGAVWRHLLNLFGFGPRCISCGEGDGLDLYEGRGGLLALVWMCAPCNDHPTWAQEDDA